MKTRFKTSPKQNKEAILENNNFLNSQNYIVPKKIYINLLKKEMKKFLYIIIYLFFSLCYFKLISKLDFWFNYFFLVFLYILSIPFMYEIVTDKLETIERNILFKYFKIWKKIYWDKK